MSFGEAAAVVLVVEVVIFGIGAWYVFVHKGKPKDPDPQPPDWGANPDDRLWEKEAAALPHSELAGVRESAKNWAGSIGALLTIGGTVGLVKGEEAFSKLTPGEGNFAFWLTLTAALLAGVAIAIATFAAQGTPALYKSIDGWTLSKISATRSIRAMNLLLCSRILVVTAALAVLATLAISWKGGIASEEPATSGLTAITTTADGRARCGELRATSLGGLWLIAGRYQSRVQPAVDVTIVDACPAATR